MLLFLIMLIIVAAAAEKWSLEHGLDGVFHESRPAQKLVEPNEEFTYISKLTNTSRRFVPFVMVKQSMPRLAASKQVELHLPSAGDGDAVMTDTCYLMPRQCIEKKVALSIPKRGAYQFRGATLYGGDFLGVNETPVTLAQYREIVVVPKPYDGAELKETLGGYLGDVSVNRFIHEDPVLTAGFREYTGREPMKMIAWNKTAAQRTLMVKQYDYTVEPRATVLVNTEYGKNIQALENCLSAARSVCEQLEDKKVQYAFMTNGATAGVYAKWRSVEEGLGQKHLSFVLEGLGRVLAANTDEPFVETLARAKHSAQQGRGHIIITPGTGNDAAWLFANEELERACGVKSLIISVGLNVAGEGCTI